MGGTPLVLAGLWVRFDTVIPDEEFERDFDEWVGNGCNGSVGYVADARMALAGAESVGEVEVLGARGKRDPFGARADDHGAFGVVRVPNGDPAGAVGERAASTRCGDLSNSTRKTAP